MPRNSALLNLFVLVLLFPLSAKAQEISVLEDSIPAISKAISLYMELIREDSFIYEGREYVGFNLKIKGHAFLGSNEWQQGNVMYKGRFFHNLPMLYDIATEEVVVRHYGEFFRVRLDREEVGYFSILSHRFFYLTGEDIRGVPIIAGFYDHLYSGNISLFVKRKKTIKESFDNREIHREFIQNDLFFIEKEGAFYPVKTKGSVLKVLKDQKREIRRHLKTRKIKFRKNPENAILKIVKFYDQHYSRK